MLTKNDCDKIRQIIREEMTVKDVTVERLKENGAIERKTIDIYLPDWVACELPNLAGALRGVQETADHAKNNAFNASNDIKMVGKILCGFESAMVKIAKVASDIPEAELIESST